MPPLPALEESIFNFIIRNDSGKELAKVPMEMLRNE